MAHYIERCAALYMHLICTAVCICMRFITVKKKQVDILISKNQALQILYLKHIKLHKLATKDRNLRKFNPHKRYCTVLLLYYNSK